MFGAVGGFEHPLGLDHDAVGKLEVHGVRTLSGWDHVLDLHHLEEDFGSALLEALGVHSF